MKLPALQYRSMVQPGTARISPFGYVREASTWASFGATVRGGAKQLLGVAEEMRNAKNKLKDAELFRKKSQRYIDFRKTVAANPMIDIDQVPLEVMQKLGIREFDNVTNDDGTTTKLRRTKIPTYEIYPEMERQFLTKLTGDLGEMITDGEHRVSWLNRERQWDLETVSKSEIATIEKGVSFERTKQQGEYNAAIAKGNTVAAIHIAKNMQFITEIQRGQLIKTAHKLGEINNHNKTITSNNIEALELASRRVNPNNDEYKGYLSIKERRGWWDDFQARISKIGTEDRAAAKTAANTVHRNVNAYSDMIIKGWSVPTDKGFQMVEKLNEMPKSLQSQAVMDKLTHALLAKPWIDAMIDRPKEYRNAIAARALQIGWPGATEYGDKLVRGAIISARDSLNEAFDGNSMQYYLERSTTGLPPLDYFNAESVADRAKIFERIGTQFGESNSFFTDQEVEEISTIMMSKDMNAQTSLMNALYEGFKVPKTADTPLGSRDVVKEGMFKVALQQLRLKMADTTFISSGELMSEGGATNIMSAKQNLLGRRLRTDDPSILQGIEKDVNRHLSNIVGGTHKFDAYRRKEIIERTKNIFTFYMDMAGEDMSTKPLSAYQDTLDHAMYLALGQRRIHEYNGSPIIPPTRDITPKQTRHFIHNLSDEQLIASGLPANNVKQFRAKLHKGDIIPMNSGGYRLGFYEPGSFTSVSNTEGNALSVFMDANVMKGLRPTPHTFWEKTLGLPGLGRSKTERFKMQLRFPSKEAVEKGRKVSEKRPDRGRAFVAIQKELDRISKEMARIAGTQKPVSELYVDEQGRIMSRYKEE